MLRKLAILFFLFPSLAFAQIGKPPIASQTLTDTSNFNGALSSDDKTVQKALDTLDDTSTSGYVPYVGATDHVNLGTKNLETTGTVSANDLRASDDISGDDLTLWDTDADTDPSIYMVSGDIGNSLQIAAETDISFIRSGQELHFFSSENRFNFQQFDYGSYLSLDLELTQAKLTASRGLLNIANDLYVSGTGTFDNNLYLYDTLTFDGWEGDGEATITNPSSNTINIDLPSQSGTLALTSSLAAYFPFCGGTPAAHEVCLEWDDVSLSLWIGGQNQGQWPYPALDYIAEYDGDNAIYEGWALYVAGGAEIGDLVWRIARNTFSGANKTRTSYAGMGGFLYAWANRSNYFDSGTAQFLLIDADNYLIIDDAGHKVRIQ